MGPSAFNIFMNDMFESCEDYNYADDNTLSDKQNTHEKLKESLECDTEHVTQRFDSNGMKANPEKYHGIAFGKKPNRPTSFNVRGTGIECSKEVILQGIYIDSGLTFNKQITVICKKTSQQTCAIMRLSTIIGMNIKLAMY